MKTTRLATAIAEAERFLQRARALQEENRSSPDSVYLYGSRKSGEVWWASVGLTRALADLRRSD